MGCLSFLGVRFPRCLWLALVLIMAFSSHAELQPLTDHELQNTHAQAGVELDLDIQTSIDSITYHDVDGVAGTHDAGILALKGVHVGSRENDFDRDSLLSDTPFEPNELARIHNVLIEADPELGMSVQIGELGDSEGNGLDVVIQQIALGSDARSAGGLLIQDLSNFIQDANVNAINDLFGLDLTTPDDGLQTLGGNFMPIQTQIITPPNGGVFNPVTGLTEGFTLDTEMTLSASFAVHLDKLAWTDEGREFGLAGVMIYQGLDTNHDGIDDTVAPATLTNMKVQSVEHVGYDGQTVPALQISNVDLRADIAIQSIYVGQPEHSLGALHIKGLRTLGTQMWIYNH